MKTRLCSKYYPSGISGSNLCVLLLMIFVASCSNSQKRINKVGAGVALYPESYLLYHNFPSKFVIPRDVEIWLPEKYGQLDSLPVLYMADGQNIFHGQQGWGGGYDPGWQVDDVLDSLNKAGIVKDVIVVGIFNIGILRDNEYMPAKPKELIRSRISTTTDDWDDKPFKERPITSNEFLKFVVEELKPFVDANFKTKKDRDNTFIAGSSMGGLISAYVICEYPDVFGGAACFSTHWTPLGGVFIDYIKEHLPNPATHKLYFDHGTIELDSMYEPFQAKVDSAMVARGFKKDINWITRRYEGQGHNAVAWHSRFHVPMEFLLPVKQTNY